MGSPGKSGCWMGQLFPSEKERMSGKVLPKSLQSLSEIRKAPFFPSYENVENMSQKEKAKGKRQKAKVLRRFTGINCSIEIGYNAGMEQDAGIILRWWMTLAGVGIAGWPIARRLFSGWTDQGYFLAKAIGIAGISLLVWWLGSLRVIPFTWPATIIAGGVITALGMSWLKKSKMDWKSVPWKTIAVEELVFLGLLWGWSWVKAHEPSINGLEKFMDYGFMRSILRSNFFPPPDMWFAGGTINYYYFGHLMTAVLTRLSGLDLVYTFNLMLATLFALTATMSFGIGRELLKRLPRSWMLCGAIFIGFLVTLSGNLQTIYAFTKGYWAEIPPPFWTIWSDFSSTDNIREGWRSYWYPNATRFIPYTIHEFPSYSFVVSDVHGHVLSIPLALLMIAMLVSLFGQDKGKLEWWELAVYGTVAGMAFMTNALDGLIYLGLIMMLSIITNLKSQISNLKKIPVAWGIVILAFGVTIIPFVRSFKSFVSGVAVNCPPAALANTKIGPLIFEETEKCQKSPLWMILVLWGFFAYCAVGLYLLKENPLESRNKRMLLVWAVFCTGLIIFPEFFYFKDIYPQHFRSNTMFKLGYQVFMLMSILAGYTIVQMLRAHSSMLKKVFLLGVAPLVFLVSIYPNFGVRSYFEELKTYRGLYGLNWMANKLPDDLAAVNWLNANIPDSQQPVVLEANGDSYTEYERISAFTGLPTVAGWVVHEWLWRGGYEPIAARAEEVRQVYEAADEYSARTVLNKYDVEFIVVGGLERQKYPQLNETLIRQLATPVFASGTITVYKVD